MMKLETERDGIEWLNAARALAIVSAWTSLGLFERLRAGPVLRADLPGDRRALDVTIPVLVHVGILAADSERVGLTPTGARLLASGGLPTGRNLDFLGDMSRMAQVISEGGPVRDAQGNKKATRGGTVSDPVQTEQFMNMLYRMSEEPAHSTLAWLSPGLPAKGAVLDLGGGHGRYARAFADAGHAVTLFDQPMVVELARKRHGDALSYIEGDYHQVESFGGPYDLVLLCNIVHGESPEANASIIARAAKSLRPGGRVAIRDMFLDEHESHPPNAVFFGVTMLFYTEGGTSPTVDRAREWFARAGLRDFQMAVFETHQMVIARRA
jgi:2-polyprenyl-3-methyl-5-hydroxy-6-metoxy-1,4-benzoquinol methylase